MKPIVVIWAAALVAGLAACAGKQLGSPAGPPMRAAVDVPDHFLTATAAGTAEPRRGEGCRNPIVDPRNETRLTLIRSADGRGDYEPSPLRYGVNKGELLRVDCASGHALGIVPR